MEAERRRLLLQGWDYQGSVDTFDKSIIRMWARYADLPNCDGTGTLSVEGLLCWPDMAKGYCRDVQVVSSCGRIEMWFILRRLKDLEKRKAGLVKCKKHPAKLTHSKVESIARKVPMLIGTAESFKNEVHNIAKAMFPGRHDEAIRQNPFDAAALCQAVRIELDASELEDYDILRVLASRGSKRGRLSGAAH